jgi:hypothetical protein
LAKNTCIASNHDISSNFAYCLPHIIYTILEKYTYFFLLYFGYGEEPTFFHITPSKLTPSKNNQVNLKTLVIIGIGQLTILSCVQNCSNESVRWSSCLASAGFVTKKEGERRCHLLFKKRWSLLPFLSYSGSASYLYRPLNGNSFEGPTKEGVLDITLLVAHQQTKNLLEVLWSRNILMRLRLMILQ